jgi:hypothetical protein
MEEKASACSVRNDGVVAVGQIRVGRRSLFPMTVWSGRQTPIGVLA